MAIDRGSPPPSHPARPGAGVANTAAASDFLSSERRTTATTYLTDVGGTKVLYPGDKRWAKVTLVLETAGPVAVGTAANLTPVLSGKGILLTTNVAKEIIIAKGDKLYIAATSVNRVQLVIESYPWIEQIAGTLTKVVDFIKRALRIED